MDSEEDIQNSTPPLYLTKTHVSRGKVRSEYTATLADEVIITIKKLSYELPLFL